MPIVRQVIAIKPVCNVDYEELLKLNNGDKERAFCHLNAEGWLADFMLDCEETVHVLPLAEASAVGPKLEQLA
jgi:hypothetical protein